MGIGCKIGKDDDDDDVVVVVVDDVGIRLKYAACRRRLQNFAKKKANLPWKSYKWLCFPFVS